MSETPADVIDEWAAELEPAFPRAQQIDRFENIVVDDAPGMTLRDYFAAKAPISLLDTMKAAGMGSDLTYCLQSINCGNEGRLLHNHARLAFQWADAMLKARDAS